MQSVYKAWETEEVRVTGKAEIAHRGEKKAQRITEEIEKAMSISWIR